MVGTAGKFRFFNTAEGFAQEGRCFPILAHELGYGGMDDLMDLLEEVSRLLHRYSKAIEGISFWILSRLNPAGISTGAAPWLGSIQGITARLRHRI